MRWISNRFHRWHLWTALALWLVFTAWTYLIVSSGLDDASDRPGIVMATTVGTVLGPMTGAICRGFQSCCLDISLSLLPYCLAALGIGVAAQLMSKSQHPLVIAIQMVLWIAGFFIWFGGGIVSFGHALG